MSTAASSGTFQNVRGYVLAGGLSSRMGRDKAFLRLNGRELVGIAVDRLHEICAEVYLLSGPENFKRDAILSCYAPLIPDRIVPTGLPVGHLGPLAGIDAALRDASSGWCLFTAIDQPLLPSHLLRQWVELAIAQHTAASWMTMAEAGEPLNEAGQHIAEAGKPVPQPLPLLLHTRLAPAIHAHLQAGERKLSRAVRRALADRQETSFEYPVTASPERSFWFRNLNTLHDLQEAQGLLTAAASNQIGLAASE